MLPIDEHVFATGDDTGGLKVWDLRKGGAVLEAREQEEYISAMAADGSGRILLTARYRGPAAPGSSSPCPRRAGGSAVPRGPDVPLASAAAAMAPWASST